jgi:hypothetical protein
MTTTPTDTTNCPSWCTGIDHDGLAGDIPFHTGELTNKEYLSVSVQLHDEASPQISLWSSAGTPEQQTINDAWYLPADAAILRRMAADLLAGADAVERAL